MHTDTSMPIAVVSEITGKVSATSRDGSMRILEKGDAVYDGEMIVTGQGDRVKLVSVNGACIELMQGKELVLGTGLFEERRGAGEEDSGFSVSPLPGSVDTATNETLQRTEAESSGIHGYLRVARISESAANSPYAFVSYTGGYSNSSEGRTAGSDAFMEGRASTDERIRISNPAMNFVQAESIFHEIDIPAEKPVYRLQVQVPEPEDDVPAAVADTYTTNEDTTLSGNVSGNDTPSGDGGNVWSVASGPAHGALTLNADGSFTYTPTANYNGPDSFTYTITDTDGDTSTATASITVTPVDDVPAAVADSYTTNEDTALSGNVSGNDTPSGDGGNVWSLASGPSHGALTLNADGSFTYTPTANYNGPDSFTYTITDTDGDTSTATASITVTPVEDAPTANPDLNSVKVNNTIEVGMLNGVIRSSGNPSGRDTDPEDDSLTVTGVRAGTAVSTGDVGSSNVGVSIAGMFGHLILNSDGSYSYSADTAAAKALLPGASVQDVFSYAISDGNGGTSYTTLSITVTGSVPIKQEVYEDALTNPPNLSQGDDETGGAVSTVSGSLSVLFPAIVGTGASYRVETGKTAGSPDPLVYTTSGDVLSSQGVQVHYVADSSGTVLTGYADVNGDGLYTSGNDRIVFTLTITDASAGAWTFALNDQVDHPASGDAGILSIDPANCVSLTEADGDRVTVSSGLVIDIENDVPSAESNTQEMTAKPIDTNLTLIIDNSGSMLDGPGESKITTAAHDAEKLIDDYSALGNVKVQIIAFSDTAQALAVWVDAADAKVILEAMANYEYIVGSTNYDAPLALMMETYGQAGKLSTPATQNVSYFISDGQPNQPDGLAGIDSSEQAQWEAFLRENSIDSYAIGVDNAVYHENLDPIAYNGTTGTERSSVLVLDINDLSGVFSNMVVPSTVTGTLIKSQGADAPVWVESLTIDGNTYTYNHDTGTVTVEGGRTDLYVFDTSTHTLTVTTLGFGDTLSLNSKLVVNMDTGAYTYMAPRTVVNESFTDSFSYVIRDYDGDRSSSTTSIKVDAPLMGTAGDDTLSGGNGADYIAGFAGNDILYGGDGNDILDGGSGNDSLYGGAGNDTIAWDPNDNVVEGGAGIDTLLIPAGSNFDFGPGLPALSGIEVLRFGVNAEVMNLAPESVADLVPLGNVLLIQGETTNSVELTGSWSVASADSGYSVYTSGAVSVKIKDGVYLLDKGTDGADNLTGINNGSQDDRLLGYAGDDTLTGGAGNDFLDGGSGNDLLRGGSGNDILVYDSSDSMPGAVDGGDGIDMLQLNNGASIDLNAPGYNADRFANMEIIDLSADPAANAISNLNAADVMAITGGSGTLYIVKGLEDTVSFGDIAPTGFRESVMLNGTTYEMDRYTGGGATVYVSVTVNTIFAIDPNGDIVSGTSGDDYMMGLDGNDSMNGYAGNDLLEGGKGDDTLDGGAGNDTLVYDSSDYAKGAVDGGDGTDRLLLTNGDSIDFNASGYNADRFAHIEIIDLATDTAVNSVSNLDAADVLSITGGSGTLYILKGSEDSVSFGDMVLAGSNESVALNGSTYTMDRFTGGGATVYVHHTEVTA